MADNSHPDNSSDLTAGFDPKSRVGETPTGHSLPPPVDQTTGFDHDSANITPQDQAKREAAAKPQRAVGGYRLFELLGQGGMGRVYRALDSNGRAVAIKLLTPGLAQSSEALERFKQEGFTASAINHPRCVFVHRVDEDAGIPFIAMELMTGQTLRDLVGKQGKLPYREAVRLILQCIDGLIEAHRQGMIHRDIKPHNCYLDADQNVKIGDFGLARSLVSDSELTRQGAFLGTPLYASPEQLLGESIDKRSDIYSLSATLYYLLAGQAPFESPNAPQVIAKIVSTEPPSFRDMEIEAPPLLEEIVMRGLSRDRNKRFQSFEEMRLALIPLLATENQTASLPRRIAANIIDSICLSMLTGLFIVSMLNPQDFDGQSAWILVAIGHAFVLLYYWIMESVLGASLGKLVLNMRVVSIHGNRASWLAVTLRVWIFFLATQSAELLANIFLGTHAPITQALTSWGAYLLGLVFLSLTWFRSGKRQMTHEWLSGTQTQVIRHRELSDVRIMHFPEWRLPVLDQPNLPAKIGRFRIQGALPAQVEPEEVWLVGNDDALGRKVWIHWKSSRATALHEDRRDCDRASCMRAIDSGILNQRHWDAYLAPEGAPVCAFEHAPHTLPWSVTRHVFEQLIQERSLEESERIPESQWTANRVWIDQSGRVIFSEPMLKLVGDSSIYPSSAVISLARASLPLGHRLRPVHADRSKDMADPSGLPSHQALKLLERLAQPTREPPDWNSISDAFRKLDTSPRSVTSVMRASNGVVHVVLFALPLVFVMIFLGLSSVMGIERMNEEADDLKLLAKVLADPENRQKLMAMLPPDLKSTWSSAEQERKLSKATEEADILIRFASGHVGAIEKAMLNESRKARERFKISIPAQQVAQAHEAIPILGRWEKSGIGAQSNPIRFVWYLAIPIVVLALFDGLTRGGVIHRFFGLHVARRDGMRASLLRTLFRACLYWSPFLLIVILSMYLEWLNIRNVWITQQLRRVLVFLPLLYLVAAWIWPQRGPHDRLSGTVMVPR